MPTALLDLTAPVDTDPNAVSPTRDRIKNLPLAIWSLRALRHVVDEQDILVAASPDHDTSIFQSFTDLTVTDPATAGNLLFERSPDGPALSANPSFPFCSRLTASTALEASTHELHRFQSTPLERTRVITLDELELAHAIAQGLPADHPAIAGIAAYAAPALAQIDAVVTDVDGTLTDGAVYMTGESSDVEAEPIRKFDTRDGQGLRMLMKHNIRVAVLSSTYRGASSRQRAAMLKIDSSLVDVGPGDKRQRFLTLCNKMEVSPARTLYFGDDINDLPAMEEAAIVACPADAHPLIQQHAQIVLESDGGRHAARELSDLILAAKSADIAAAAQ